MIEALPLILTLLALAGLVAVVAWPLEPKRHHDMREVRRRQF